MKMLTNLSAAGMSDSTLYTISVAMIAASVILALIAIVLLAVVLTKRGNKTVSKNVPGAVISADPNAAGNDDDAAVAAAIAAAIAATEDQGAVLAAITAAISVVWESEHPGTGFRVVSYRHIDKRSPWNAK